MMRDPNKKYQGTHFDDPFWEWIKGYTRREEAIRDGSLLFSDIFDFRNDLFPIRRVPVPDEPTRYTLEQNYFSVKFTNGRIQKDLTEYFTDTDRFNSSISYGSANDLAGFFEFCFHSVLLHGKDAYAVQWGLVQIDNKKYFLPKYFNGLNTSNIKIVTNEKGKHLTQKFSWFAKFMHDYYEYSNHVVPHEELLIFDIAEKSPASRSMKYLKAMNQYMEFSLLNGQANLEPRNHSIDLEKTRYYPSSIFIRRGKIAKTRVERIFKRPIGGYGLGITEFYEAFAYVEYRKYLNKMREFFVSEFNEQIMRLVKDKNNFKRNLELTYDGFTPDSVIDEVFEEYKENKITVKELVEKIKDQ